MAFTLDPSKAVTMQISNDAFFYLRDEEEPLDESNLEEAEEIQSMFPNGFVIDGNWEYVEDEPDTIQVTFIPYIKATEEYDGTFTEFSGWAIQFNIYDKNRGHVRHYNELTGEVISDEDCEIKYFFNKPWLVWPIGAKAQNQYPLWKDCVVFNKKEATALLGLK